MVCRRTTSGPMTTSYGAPLKRFLTLFGFELDNTRQSVECMQDMYHIDKTPIPLLYEIGGNFDTP